MGQENLFQRKSLRFKERKDFGEFCLLLREVGIPFDLLGSQSISLSESVVVGFPPKAQAFIERCHLLGSVVEYDSNSRDCRHSPTEQEANVISSSISVVFAAL